MLCVACCVLCCVVCCVLCVVCVCVRVFVCVCVFLSLSLCLFVCFLFVSHVDCPVCGVNAEILYVSVLWRPE